MEHGCCQASKAHCKGHQTRSQLVTTSIHSPPWQGNCCAHAVTGMGNDSRCMRYKKFADWINPAAIKNPCNSVISQVPTVPFGHLCEVYRLRARATCRARCTVFILLCTFTLHLTVFDSCGVFCGPFVALTPTVGLRAHDAPALSCRHFAVH